MKRLYLLTNSFPYGKGEKSFILPELNYLKDNYDITILSLASELEKSDVSLKTGLSNNICVKNLDRTIPPVKKILLFLFSHFHIELWREYARIVRGKKNRIKNMYFAAAFYVYGLHFFYQLKSMKADWEKGTIFYSYWYSYQALSLVMLKKKYSDIKIITRAHGYDLYNENTTSGRQFFKNYMNKKLDAIFFISEEGRRYYKNNFSNGKELEIYRVSRLGVPPKSKRNPLYQSDVFELVSCSNVIPVKRVELIIQALSCIEDYAVHWTHFGDGDSMDEIKKLSVELLVSKDNITYSLMGHKSNSDIMKYYEKNKVDCFISTSSSEGIPVSIQEVLSYGIPVIGTDVGGVSEAIDGNGVLLSANPSIQDITDALSHMAGLESKDRLVMRNRSYQLWEERFNSDENYRAFVRQLTDL